MGTDVHPLPLAPRAPLLGVPIPRTRTGSPGAVLLLPMAAVVATRYAEESGLCLLAQGEEVASLTFPPESAILFGYRNISVGGSESCSNSSRSGGTSSTTSGG